MNNNGMQEQTREAPKWLLPRRQVDEVSFCEEFYMHNHLTWMDGYFFSPEGRVTDENALRRKIYEKLRPWCQQGLANKVDSILATLRMEAPRYRVDENEEGTCVFTANGMYNVCESTFSSVKNMCRFRLPVDYNPEAPKPEAWLKFLSELLYEEDIPTLQEYMGYCLLPSTRAQKMLIITGKGGEGKSRIGVVLKSLLGDNMALNSIAKIESSPFARADLEHMLLMVDDDLQMDALKQTNYLKSIISAELPMDLERKGIQSYQGQLYVRFLAFGNDTLQALHDRSHGFFRRQIILTAREKDPNRVDDPYLADWLVAEREGILLWCIEGLRRLWGQKFRFTQSRRARHNLLESMRRGNNAEEFFQSRGYIQFDPDGCITSKLLYDIYRDWCRDNAVPPLGQNSLMGHLNQNATRYSIAHSRSINTGNGKFVRGYNGIRACSRF